jgi:hypothetical protein
METTFSDEERRLRTVLRARAAEENAEADRARVLGAVVDALDPFPEARAAVLASMARLRGSDG